MVTVPDLPPDLPRSAAMASLYTGLPARSDTAMTGEVTLTGLELPDHVRQEMQFHFVERVEQVLELLIPNLSLSSLALAS